MMSNFYAGEVLEPYPFLYMANGRKFRAVRVEGGAVSHFTSSTHVLLRACIFLPRKSSIWLNFIKKPKSVVDKFGLRHV